eukprot:3711339-Pyramimonas_sp.AAC.1
MASAGRWLGARLLGSILHASCPSFTGRYSSLLSWAVTRNDNRIGTVIGANECNRGVGHRFEQSWASRPDGQAASCSNGVGLFLRLRGFS